MKSSATRPAHVIFRPATRKRYIEDAPELEAGNAKNRLVSSFFHVPTCWMTFPVCGQFVTIKSNAMTSWAIIQMQISLLKCG